MYQPSFPKVQNIKIGFRYDSKTYNQNYIKEKLDHLSTKHSHNFSVLRNKYVYIIYWTSGYVNVTGIKQEALIADSQLHFSYLMNIKEEISDPSIHNICASGRFSNQIDLERIHEIVREKSLLSAIYNLSYFPALFLKNPKYGTCVMYKNGKYSLVGVKKTENIIPFIEKVRELLNSV